MPWPEQTARFSTMDWTKGPKGDLWEIYSIEYDEFLIFNQWPFEEPKLEVPTIYKACFSGLCKGISSQNMALNGTVPQGSEIQPI